MLLPKPLLLDLYCDQCKSIRNIAAVTGSSIGTVHHSMEVHRIPRRPISEALYRKHHPDGGFRYCPPRTAEEQYEFGFGLGIYWSKGTLADTRSVRLSTSRLDIIESFMDFLVQFFRVKRSDFRFQLHVPKDASPKKALDSWSAAIKIPREQFSVVVTKSRAWNDGTVTLFYHDKSLLDMLLELR